MKTPGLKQPGIGVAEGTGGVAAGGTGAVTVSIAAGVVTAKLAKGTGTLIITKTPVGGGTTTDVGAAQASPATYTLQQPADRGYTFSGRQVTTSAPVGAINPVVAPQAPTITGVTAGSNSVTATLTRNADNGGDTVTGDRLYVYQASNNDLLGQANGTSPITMTGIANGVALVLKAASIGATAGVGPLSAAFGPVTPTAGVTPVAMRNSATLMGDSLMDYGNPTATGETSLSYLGWMNDILRKNGGIGIDAVNLRALGGTPLATHLSNQLPLALADATDIVWFHGGVNSFNPTYSTATWQENAAIMANIIGQLAAAKKLVIIDSITPVWQSGSTGARQRAAEFPLFNAATQAECAKYSNVYYNDQYALLADPALANTTRNPIVDVVQTGDGIHLTSTGARLLGEDAASKIGPLLSLATKYKTRGANLLPAFTGGGGSATVGGGSVTGTANIPAGWNVSVASGSSSVAVSDSPTNAGFKRFVINNPATSVASTVYISADATTQAALLASLAVNDVVQGGMDFKTIGTANRLTRVSASLRFGGGASALWDAMQRSGNESDTYLRYNQTANEGRRYWHPLKITSLGATPQVEFIMAINLGPQTGGTVTIDIALPDLFKLT